MKNDAIPEFSRAEIITQPMHRIDHTCARQDGPPEIPAMEPLTTPKKVVKGRH